MMNPIKRVAVNAIAQYVRTALCMILALYSTRIVLCLLGQEDFGIYALIGNLIMLMGFITNSLAVSTQRFMSYSWGSGGVRRVREIYDNAFLLHLFIGLVVVVILCIVERPLVHSYLRIPVGRIGAADFVYYTVAGIMAVTFLTAPIKALFIARENIVYVSVIDIVDAIVKLVGAIYLQWVTIDTLKAYAMLIAMISLLTFFAYFCYGMWKYEECSIPRFSALRMDYLRQMMGFATWNVYSVGSTVVRTQGIAVILNRFLGTVVNAAYGIALQVSAALSAIAGSIINAMNPQLMKAEGKGDRLLMLRYATLESKYSFLILATLLIPVVVELPQVLTFWLKDYPHDADLFCAFIIVAMVWDQSTIGLTSANQAEGNIRNYSLLISTLRLLVLPAVWGLLYWGFAIGTVMWAYLLFEVLCGAVRIPFLKYSANLDVGDYIHQVYVRSIIPVVGNVLVSVCMTTLIDSPLRFLLTEVVCVMVSIVLIFFFSLTHIEREYFLVYLHLKLRRHD